MDKFVIRKPKILHDLPVLPVSENIQEPVASTSYSKDSVGESNSDLRVQPVVVEKRSRVHSSEESNNSDNEYNDIPRLSPMSPARKKKKKYIQHFRNLWTEKFPGLKCVDQDQNQVAMCKICNKKLSCNYNHISRHFNSKTHQLREHSCRTTPHISQFADTKRTHTDNLVKCAELKLIAFLHEHNLSFMLMDHLPKLIASACPDSIIAKKLEIGRTKATNLTKNQFVEEALTELRKNLDINKLYSLIIDETTDVSTKKSLAVIVRFHDDVSIKDRFLGLTNVEDGTAKGLFDAVMKLLTDNNIPIENMTGFGADNASVMMGNKTGVQFKLREINPSILVMGCICHSLHLCASAAALKLPKSVEEFLRNVINHFSNSSKRIDSFKEHQEFVNIKPLKLLKTSQTRWLSLQAAVERVLQSWDALVLYFTSVVYTEDLRVTSQILENLKNPVYKIYFSFLSYALGFVNTINKEFQSETCKVDVLILRLTELYKTFLRNFLSKEYLDKTSIHEIKLENPHNFVKIENMYFGAKVEKIIENGSIDKNELSKFRNNALAFYIELCKQIIKRVDFNDPLLLYIQKFSPTEVLSGKHLSITKILDFFPQLIPYVDVESLNSEYRLVSSITDLQSSVKKNFEEFWNQAMEMKNGLDETMFPNLSRIIKAIMTIPHSSASAERIFSQLTLIKSKQRNRLEVDTCESIMHTKSLLGLKGDLCYQFEPSTRLIKTMSSFKR